ncbi:MAG: hypothetical protein ACFFB0_19895 [Promethearchaeota archaeon]
MEKNNRKIYILAVLFTSILFLCLFQIVNPSYAQLNENSLLITDEFAIKEFAEDSGQIFNSSSIDIQLPEANWSISNIQVNFSHISLGSEIKSIEDSETTYEIVWNKNINFRTFALGTQLKISEVTEIFGVYIKAYMSPQATEIIKFQIQGFDNINYIPNNTIYRSIDLNISTDLDWYYQDFSSNPITLSIGNYSLVMNGTDLSESVDAKYFWAVDNEDPQIPYLHTSSSKTPPSWQPSIVNTSFLYKLNQRVDRTYFPNEINMTAEFEGATYEIVDGPISGRGILEIPNLSYINEDIILNIPIKINRSLTLNFNYNYSINLSNEFLTDSLVNIKESRNHWSISPILSRISENYYIKFDIPKSWYNFSIFRNLSNIWENVTSLVNIDINNGFIIIPNNTIVDGSEWNIIADSPNIDFTLNFPNKEWETGQKLQFSVVPPIIQGKITFVLTNTLGFSEIIDVKEVTSDGIVFVFDIPTTYLNGTYIAKIYWNNNTDAGFQSQEILITTPKPPPPEPTPSEPINPFLIVLIVVASIGATIASFASYRVVKSIRTKRAEEAQKIYDKCMDILNLDYLMVTDKKSGLSVYDRKFTGKEMNGTLISGFLQAIHQFGIELIKIEDQSQTIKLEYANSIVIMTEFVNLRLILIMKESPSINFLYSLEDLAYDIYKEYGNFIDNFNGDIKPFKGMEGLLRKHLNISFIYPLKLATKTSSENVKIKQDERAYIDKAVSYMKQTKKKYFYIASIIPENTCSPKDIEHIMDLIEKNIFQPVLE